MKQLAPKLFSWASILDDQTRIQAEQLSRMPFIDPYVVLEGDAHFGKGASVGTVIPTKGAIIPAAVGVDIGCGMIAHRTQFYGHDLRGMDLTALRVTVEDAIPSSAGRYNTHLTTSARRRVEELEAMPGAQAAYELAQNWPLQLGSLGSGNHFIEVTLDDQDRVWLFLHSGSRGVGNKLAMKHIGIAKMMMRHDDIHLVNPDLSYLTEGTGEFDDYITDLLWAQHFALLNRQEMMQRLTYEFGLWIGEPVHVSHAIQCHHNYTERVIDVVNGGMTWLSRKGAINAERGVLGLIPGSMGVASYVVEGLGHAEGLNSAPHGAGRLYSRGAAKRTFTMDDMAKQMVGVEYKHDKSLLDEIPGAYKPITQVMEDASEVVRPLYELHPLVNVKGM